MAHTSLPHGIFVLLSVEDYKAIGFAATIGACVCKVILDCCLRAKKMFTVLSYLSVAVLWYNSWPALTRALSGAGMHKERGWLLPLEVPAV